jgi:RNA polymerase II subunit A small phosphatase-like protein
MKTRPAATAFAHRHGTARIMGLERPILLILDLDETLVHSVEEPLDRPHDFRAGPYFVYRRPHLDGFLAACSAAFRLAVWSSGGEGYVRAVVGRIAPPGIDLAFLWSCDRCVRRYDPESQEEYHLKDLGKVKRLGHDLRRVLIADDTPRKVARQYGNIVHVPPYHGEAGDDLLPRLAEYLLSLREVPDVRALEKRGWWHAGGP